MELEQFKCDVCPHKQKWIKVEWHEITTEEREENSIPDEIAYWIDCKLPDDGEEILCTDGKTIWLDTNYIDDGFSLDSGWGWDEIKAWMPLPEPYKEEGDQDG